MRRLSAIPHDAKPQWGKLRKDTLTEHLIWVLHHSMGESQQVPYYGTWFSSRIIGPLFILGLIPVLKNLQLPAVLQQRGITMREPGTLSDLHALMKRYLSLVQADAVYPRPPSNFWRRRHRWMGPNSCTTLFVSPTSIQRLKRSSGRKRYIGPCRSELLSEDVFSKEISNTRKKSTNNAVISIHTPTLCCCPVFEAVAHHAKDRHIFWCIDGLGQYIDPVRKTNTRGHLKNSFGKCILMADFPRSRQQAQRHAPDAWQARERVGIGAPWLTILWSAQRQSYPAHYGQRPKARRAPHSSV